MLPHTVIGGRSVALEPPNRGPMQTRCGFLAFISLFLNELATNLYSSISQAFHYTYLQGRKDIVTAEEEYLSAPRHSMWR